MRTSYINKIKANITIYSNKKTLNLLEGTYSSVYKGRSLNFEDLREYVIGDNVKDIDWKASARSRTLLVKRFIAERKHNILFVIDSGTKMEAHTKGDELKKDTALMTAGTLGYLAAKNGDYVSAMFKGKDKELIFPFKSDLFSLERILSAYDLNADMKEEANLNELLEHAVKYLRKRMIIFIITDLKGMENLNNTVLKRICLEHDVLLVNIEDAELLGESLFDVDSNAYVPTMLLNDPKLIELDKLEREKIYESSINKLKKYGITLTSISSSKVIIPKLVELLERHRYASNH